MDIRKTFIVAEHPKAWVIQGGGSGHEAPIHRYDIHKVHLLSDDETFVIERGLELKVISRKEFIKLQNNFTDMLEDMNDNDGGH